MLNEVRYPNTAQEHGKSGKVNAIFTIDKFGKTSNYHVDNPIGYGMDEEVIRVLKLMADNWLPGILNGEPVEVEVVFPFTFKLNN
jgi:protein TonB